MGTNHVATCKRCGLQHTLPRLYALHLVVAHDGWTDATAEQEAIKEFGLSPNTQLLRR